MTSTIEELNPGLKGLGTYKYGWSDSDAAGVSARRGLSEEVVRDHEVGVHHIHMCPIGIGDRLELSLEVGEVGGQDAG